jgi:hypothetical protein
MKVQLTPYTHAHTHTWAIQELQDAASKLQANVRAYFSAQVSLLVSASVCPPSIRAITLGRIEAGPTPL